MPSVRSIRTLAVLVCVAGAANACARSGGTAGAPPGGSVPAVRFAIAADPQSLDPLFAHPDANSVEQQVARLAFEPFIDVDEHGTPVPVLLDRIPTVENGGVSRGGRGVPYPLRGGLGWGGGARG